MTSKVTFKIVVEQDDIRLETFLTESGDLAFHMTNAAGTLDAYIEADALRFEEGLSALIDIVAEAEDDECGCGHDHHHHHHDCGCGDDDCDDCDEDEDEDEEEEQ